MKNFITILFFFVSISTFAQYNSLSAEVFQTYLSSGGYCPSNDYRGSINYDTQKNKFFYCTGASTGSYTNSSFKEVPQGISFTEGNLGISNGLPTYNLDLSPAGDSRFSNKVLIMRIRG